MRVDRPANSLSNVAIGIDVWMAWTVRFLSEKGAIRTSDLERHSPRGRWPADYSNEQGQRLAMLVRPMAIDRSTAGFDGTARDA